MTIRYKLIAAFIFTTIIPIVIISFFVTRQEMEREVTYFNQSSIKQITEVDNAFNMFFSSVAENVSTLSQTKLPKSADQSLPSYTGVNQASKIQKPTSGISGELFSLFEEIGKAHPSYKYVYLGTSHGGYIQWPSTNIQANYDPRSRGWFKTGMSGNGQPTRTAAYLFEDDNSTIISTAQRFTADDGTQGVIGLDVSLKQLTEVVKRVKFGETGYLMLVEDSGNVLADARHEDNNFKALESLGEGYRELAQHSAGSYEVKLGEKEYTANIYKSEQLGWKYIGLIETSEIMAGAKKLALFIVTISVVLIAIFAACGVALSTLLVSPIKNTAKSLQEIANGEGDLTRRLAVKGKDETTALAEGFNSFMNSIQQLIHGIHLSSQQVQQNASTIGQYTNALDDTARRQSSAVDMLSTAFHEMVATANEVATNCNRAAISAQDGENQANKGLSVITLMITQVEHLGQRIRTASDSIGDLANDTKSITEILVTIKGIADQTNLLALNAAIEAARAGDHGRGFAVVADEVRALAKRTSDSTEQINHLLVKLVSSTQRVTHEMQESLDQSNASVAHSSQVEAAFSGVHEAVTIIKDMNIQIATAAEEQHQVAEEINRHIEGINNDAAHVTKVSGTTKSVTGSLVQVSEELIKLVDRFKI